MPESYHVRVTKDDFVFSAAHFITFDDNVCERLHGHNYRVAAEVHGPLDQNHYVVDFIALCEVLKAIVDQLDHRVLLPADHPRIEVVPNGREVEATFEDRRWVFPRGDCTVLPVPNTTAELLARYIGQRLLDDLEVRTGSRPRHVKVELDENHGHWAICELRDQ